MIQRFLYLALQNGLQQFADDPTLFDDLFSDLYELGDTELATIKKVFADKPPHVIHGYAPRDVDPPVYSIVLQGEQETETFLNNDAIQVLDQEDPDFGADIKASIWSHTYNILVYTQHPDHTMYCYEVAKAILMSSTNFFADQRMFDIRISGQDLAPDPRYLPEHLFARRLVFKTDRLFETVDRASLVGKAFNIAGLHIDRSGSPSDVGGVKTLIDPVALEDLDE